MAGLFHTIVSHCGDFSTWLISLATWGAVNHLRNSSPAGTHPLDRLKCLLLLLVFNSQKFIKKQFLEELFQELCMALFCTSGRYFACPQTWEESCLCLFFLTFHTSVLPRRPAKFSNHEPRPSFILPTSLPNSLEIQTHIFVLPYGRDLVLLNGTNSHKKNQSMPRFDTWEQGFLDEK